MREPDELTDIPPIVPSRDDVETHRQTRKRQSQQIVRPGNYTEKVKVSTWPVRIMITLLTLSIMAGAGGAYYFLTELYEADLQASRQRLDELETRMALMGATAEESDNSLMQNINQAIEQYDLLWANWRANNRQFEDLESEIAKLVLVNTGQDEAAANLSRQLAEADGKISANQTRINALVNDLDQLGRSVTALDASMTGLDSLRNDLQSIRSEMNSGDSTLLGLVGRLEYVEQSMESVNAHRLQINESLFRLQENVEAMQRSMLAPGAAQ